MNKKIGNVLLALVIISLLINLFNFISINNINSEKEEIESKYDKLVEKSNKLKAEIENATKENEKLIKKLDYIQHVSYANNSLVREQIKLIDLKEDPDFLRENEVFPIYDANIYSYDREIILYISFPRDLPLDGKLIEICSKLSQYCFKGLPIQFEKINYIQGNKIAVINLKESPINEGVEDLKEEVGYTWKGNYFQDSTGGILTYTKLTETFLQRDYDGEWIDGVQFLYEGNEIDFEHVPGLKDIIYR